jgi:hypothetical protein
MPGCTHQHPFPHTVIDNVGRTACCNALSAVRVDDWSEYCRCCGATVTGGAVTAVHTFRVDEQAG